MKMVINNALSIERKTETIIYFVAPSKSLPHTLNGKEKKNVLKEIRTINDFVIGVQKVVFVSSYIQF